MRDTIIIGRNSEMKLLERYMASGHAEFIAVYGRRRVGKTYLIRHFFDNHFAFDMTGIIEGTKSEQMAAFHDALRQIGYKGPRATNWLDAFFALRDTLKSRLSPNVPCVIFIDELPCLDTSRSRFVHALGHFWNTWASWQPEVKLIVCGSATSWMVKNIINNHGGLHDRVTHELALKPFTLSEAESFFHTNHFVWNRLNVLHAYMAVGGIPYYLNLFRPDESPAQGIDRMFFSEHGELQAEYRRLFSSLFRHPEPYLSIIKLLASKPMGMTKKEISQALNVSNNGYLGDLLTDLVYCDFIRSYNQRSQRVKENSSIYKLVDFYTIFYHTFVHDARSQDGYWSALQQTPAINTWLGLSFERVCLMHIPQIKTALGISGVVTNHYSWRSNDPAHPAQVDLIIERKDMMINLCEIKYSKAQYELLRDEYLKIERRIEAFRQATATRCGIIPTLITTFGLSPGAYSTNIPASLTMDNLFG